MTRRGAEESREPLRQLPGEALAGVMQFIERQTEYHAASEFHNNPNSSPLTRRSGDLQRAYERAVQRERNRGPSNAAPYDPVEALAALTCWIEDAMDGRT